MSIIKSVGLTAWAALVATAAYGCSGSTTSSGGNGDGMDSGAGTGTGTMDGSATTMPAGDSGSGGSMTDAPTANLDAGVDAALVCSPMSTTGFTPKAPGTPVANRALCTTQQISDFVTACGDNGTDTTCNAWFAANAAGDAGAGTACGNCIAAPDNSGGIYTDPSGYFNPNYGACIAIEDPTNGKACNTDSDEQSDCEGYACDSCNKGYGACLNAADMGECSTYVTAANTACAADLADGGAAATCAPSTSQAQDPDFTFIATLICGGAVSDASTD